ncbi:MAG: hypothetical protein WA323_24805 [Candidatus Nitrosopolaris sp.]
MVTIELPDMVNKALLTCYSDLIGILGKRERVTKTKTHDDGVVN